MLQRGGEVVIRMLENVRQVTIGPLIDQFIEKGTVIYTDEYDIYSRLEEWGYGHETVCHAKGEYARDDDGDGFCEVHVNTMEGSRSLHRSWLHPTVESRKRACRFTSGSSNSSTTPEPAVRDCWAP